MPNQKKTGSALCVNKKFQERRVLDLSPTSNKIPARNAMALPPEATDISGALVIGGGMLGIASALEAIRKPNMIEANVNRIFIQCPSILSKKV